MGASDRRLASERGVHGGIVTVVAFVLVLGTVLSAYAYQRPGNAYPMSSTVAAVQENVRHVANVPGSTGGHVVVEGNRLYVGAYGFGMTIFDITNPTLPVKIGEYKPGFQTLDDPGLRADAVPDAAVYDGKHIAILNGTSREFATQQTEFLDVTDPAQPLLLHRFTGSSEGEAHNGDIVDARRLWLPSGGRSGNMVRIYDLNPLLANPPARPTRLFGANIQTMWINSPYRIKFRKPHGVVPSHIHDLQVYTDFPVLLLEGDWVDQDGDGAPDPTYTNRDLAFYAASQDYSLSFGSGTTPPNSAVYIIDITEPTAPLVINKIPAVAGHRYLHEVQLLDGDPSIMFTSDEDLHNGCDAGGVYSWRLSEDLTQATFLDSWFNGNETLAAVCSSHVFSSGGDYVFMGSYQAGMQVIDFGDPANLTRAGQYIAEGANSWGAEYHNGYIYVGDFGARGLDVFEFLPNVVAKGLVKAMNPATRTTLGITERACQNGLREGSPADGVDALVVPIPEDKADGTHRLRGSTSVQPGTELDISFFDSNCEYINANNADDGASTSAFIPKSARYATIDLFTNAGPGRVYAQIDP